MLILKKSKGGAVAATLFLVAAAAVLAWVFFVMSRNPADSGESAFWLLPFTMPWVSFAPAEWGGHIFAAACVLLNALIVYGVFGGLRFKSTGK